MANTESISAAELREYLSSQITRLNLLKSILIVFGILVIFALIGHMIYYYNILTSYHFDVLNESAKVESALQFRANLVPVIVESVVSFVGHEDNVFISAVDARERSLTRSDQVAEKLKEISDQPVGKVLDKIMAIAEQYPDLKTSEPFQLLMKQVYDAEAQILKHRIEFNDKVNIYTTTATVFPGNVYSAIFGFPEFEYFHGTKQSEWREENMQTQGPG